MPPFAPGQRLFLRLRGQVTGPYSEEQLEALREQGVLLASHEVSADGERWVTAGETGLFALAGPAGEGAFPNVAEEGPDRRRRAAPRRGGMPTWLLLAMASILGLLTSLAAYFLIIRPLTRRAPSAGAPRATEKTGAAPVRRGETKRGTAGLVRLGELQLTVLPQAPRVDGDLTVVVAATAKGASVPHDRLSFTLAGEKQEATFDATREAFRLKAPDRAMDECSLLVTLAEDDRYEAASGLLTFAVTRLSRGAFELVADDERVSRGQPVFVRVKWSVDATPPPSGVAPRFTIDGRAVHPSEVKAVGGGWYELGTDLAVGPHTVGATFSRDDRYAEVTARRAVAVTVVKLGAVVRLALPEGGYLPGLGALVGVVVTGEGGVKLTGDVELWRAGAAQALARATLKDGGAAFVVKELEPGKVDLEARYLGDGKDHGAAKAVARDVPVVRQVAARCFPPPYGSPGEGRDYTFPKEARKGATKLADHGLDADKAYHLRLVFPADTPGAADTKHTFTAAADKGELALSWACAYVPYKKVEKEQVDSWLRLHLDGKGGEWALSYEMPEAAVTQELLFEKKLYADEPLMRRGKVAAVRRRLEALRLLRANGTLEVHEGSPKDKPSLPRLVIRLDGEQK